MGVRNVLRKRRQRNARRRRERETRIRKEFEDATDKAKRFPFGAG
jgi:hypothetical protein